MFPSASDAKTIRQITLVRSEYISARVIRANLEHRLAGTRHDRQPGYLPPEIDFACADGDSRTIAVRDYDVRFLDRVPPATAIEHLDLICRARARDPGARIELERRTRDTHKKIAARFISPALIENEHVVPYTTTATFSETEISNKGAILLDLYRRGLATADFNILAAGVYRLPAADRARCLMDAVRNLEWLSGRRLEDPGDPLLVAVRSGMAEHIPGFMPTYLNVGLTPAMLPGLPLRYGEDAAVRIRLNNRKTILEALEPEAFRAMEKNFRPDMGRQDNLALAVTIEERIEERAPELLQSAAAQLLFFLTKAYDYYESHLDALRNFMVRETHLPAIILQRMVCSVIDRSSYAGVLYSRHPRLGTGVFLQFARTIFGEDLMTGRLQPKERFFRSREETRTEFPAIFHFWPRLAQLENIFLGPVMVEFTGVHGTFTVLQVNPAELAGAGMLTAVMDLYRAGKIPAPRVRELIKPYHVRQIESDAIDPKSLQALTPFARGLSVLPRGDVTGRAYFSAAGARRAREARSGENIILAKERFVPQDAVHMQGVSGICSLSPAAIHVVTAAQNLGVPALLNLEEDGVTIDRRRGAMVNRDGLVLQEGDWVTISSRLHVLYVGKAVFAPARLLRLMAGEPVPLPDVERPRFESLAADYRAYREILESVDASEFKSLQDLGHAVRYGRLRGDAAEAAAFINRCFDANRDVLARRLLESTLGTHLANMTAFELLTPERQIPLLKSALAIARERGITGYQAGAFVIGSLVKPESPISFWRSFVPREIAELLNEWVLHQKYLDLIDDVGERKISRAKDALLSHGLGTLRVHRGLAAAFMTLKLSGVGLAEVRQAISDAHDPQTAEFLDMLARPFAEFFDFADPRNLAPLRRICDTEGIDLPDPGDA